MLDKVQQRRKELGAEIPPQAPAVVKPDASVVVQNGGIVGEVFQNRASVGIADIAVIIERPLRPVGDCHAQRSEGLCIRSRGKIIEVVPAIIAANTVRRVEIDRLSVLRARVLFFSVGDAVIDPVGKVVYRRGPDGVVLHTKAVGIRGVVASVEIDPVAEDVGLAVRDIFV